MKYQIFFKTKAIKDLKKVSKEDAKKIAAKIKEMEGDLQGDVKNWQNILMNTDWVGGVGIGEYYLK